MTKKLAIFDLDGTLLDTLGDLASACNYVLQHNGYPTHPLDSYRYRVGGGINKLIERALPDAVRSARYAAELRPEFIARYREHLSDRTRPYPGIPELLERLESEGILLAVASNKYHEGTRKLVEHFFADRQFLRVSGQRDGVPVKPDPAIVLEILEASGLDAQDAFFIGDSDVDMFTAANAHVESIGVEWGFRPRTELIAAGAGHIARTPEDILRLCTQIRNCPDIS